MALPGRAWTPTLASAPDVLILEQAGTMRVGQWPPEDAAGLLNTVAASVFYWTDLHWTGKGLSFSVHICHHSNFILLGSKDVT